mgnify:FL=1
MSQSDPEIQCGTLSGDLDSGSSTTISCSLNADDMVYLADRDGDNDGTNEGDADQKEDVIDAVCWNDGSGTDVSCDGASDAVIAAGLWAVNTYVNDANNAGIRLNSNGNNDDGVSDWAAIPEFGTLLMPIASVLLIVGYNYRRKETKA